jgi:outer membrane protein TolC
VVLGAQLELPVLAPGRADVLAAEADVGAAEARLAEVARLDEVDVVTLSAQVELAAQTVASWRELPVEVTLGQVMQRVTAGEATLADVLPARDALVGAALSAIDAREAHARAALDTWTRVGRSPLGGAP